MKRYLGVDLHRTQFVVCTRLENGEQEVRQWRIAGLPKFVEQLQSQDQIAVEAMGTTARFYDAVGASGAGGGSQPTPVQGNQRVGEERRKRIATMPRR